MDHLVKDEGRQTKDELFGFVFRRSSFARSLLATILQLSKAHAGCAAPL
jgi:hypothetical protein